MKGAHRKEGLKAGGRTGFGKKASGLIPSDRKQEERQRADKDSGGRERAQEVSKVPVWWLPFAQADTKESWAPVTGDLPQQEEDFRDNCMHA